MGVDPLGVHLGAVSAIQVQKQPLTVFRTYLGVLPGYGGIIQGPKANKVTFAGTTDVYFSAEAAALATKLTAKYVAFNGWQELSRK